MKALQTSSYPAIEPRWSCDTRQYPHHCPQQQTLLMKVFPHSCKSTSIFSCWCALVFFCSKQLKKLYLYSKPKRILVLLKWSCYILIVYWYLWYFRNEEVYNTVGKCSTEFELHNCGKPLSKNRNWLECMFQPLGFFLKANNNTAEFVMLCCYLPENCSNN